jgi:hypothetical protein
MKPSASGPRVIDRTTFACRPAVRALIYTHACSRPYEVLEFLPQIWARLEHGGLAVLEDGESFVTRTRARIDGVEYLWPTTVVEPAA